MIFQRQIYQPYLPHILKLHRISKLKFCVYHVITGLTLTIAALGSVGLRRAASSAKCTCSTVISYCLPFLVL